MTNAWRRQSPRASPSFSPAALGGQALPQGAGAGDLVATERMAGRKVAVNATHTETRDVTERMDDILTRHGFRVAVMTANPVAPDRT